MTSIVYILINDAMPGLVKIGLTGTSLEQRIRELDTTSVPLPFKCYYAAEVGDVPPDVEIGWSALPGLSR